MVSIVVASSLSSSSPCPLFSSRKLSSSKTFSKQSQAFLLSSHRNLSLPYHFSSSSKRGLRQVCFFNAGDKSDPKFQDKESGLEWPILRRWEVPWEWQTVSLTSLACGLGFVLTGLVEATALPYLDIRPEELSLDEKAEILFLDQGITTAVILGIIYATANTFQPLPEDFFKYDLREPFNLQKGWLLWAGIGLVGALIAIALTGVAVSFFNGEAPQRETDALVRLLPLIGSSNVSTACLVGITGVLAPLLEETVFRGFFMASLTKWVPTPVAVIISAAVFSLAHLTPGEFPQLFVLGTALGISYAQTHNLLTPITIHAFWNSGVILLLTFLQDSQTGHLTGTGHKIGRLFELTHLHIPPMSNICASSTTSPIQLWHQRLAHSSLGKLRLLMSQGFLGSLSIASLNCTAFQTTKQPTLSFDNSTSISASPFDLVHSDIWGPTPTPTTGSSR